MTEEEIAEECFMNECDRPLVTEVEDESEDADQDVDDDEAIKALEKEALQK